MNKLNFDGRLLEGKNVEKQIRDIAYEMDFSGKELDYNYTISNRNFYHRKKFFIHNCN